jgi:hypothetical protein
MCSLGLLAWLAVFADLKQAVYEIDICVYRGNPAKDRKDTLLSSTLMRAGSGAQGVILCRRAETINGQQVTLGEAAWIRVTNTGHGAIKVNLTFAYRVSFGQDDAPGSHNEEITSTRTIQSGERLRLDLGDNPTFRRWLEVTIRKEK